MLLVIMIRVNISDYCGDLVRSYYHDNSLIKCTETRSLAQKPAVKLGSSPSLQARPQILWAYDYRKF